LYSNPENDLRGDPPGVWNGEFSAENGNLKGLSNNIDERFGMRGLGWKLDRLVVVEL
jgi:hypothetical protein